MTERPCIRCGTPFVFEEGQLNYCSVCGAPQIFLSEALQQQAAEDARLYGERLAGTAAVGGEVSLSGSRGATLFPGQPRGGSAPSWPAAVESALLSSGVALAAGVGATLFAPLAALDWLWLASAPVLTVGFYSNRAKVRTLTGSFAARLGLLTGLLVLAGSAVAFVAGMVIARFALHRGDIDAAVTAAFAQVRLTTQAQYGASAAPVLHLLAVPEFRVGFLLWMVAISAFLYLLYATVTAGLAGLLLRRRGPA